MSSEKKQVTRKWDEEGRRLRAIREALGMSQNHFASALGRTPNTIRNCEEGWQRLSLRTMQEAERLLAEMERLDSKHPRPGQPLALAEHAPQTARVQSVVLEAVKMAKDEKVIAAAKALMAATGASEDEAVATVISMKLDR